MPVKLLCWNVEWMNDLFDAEGAFRDDDYKPQHNKSTTVRERREHLSGVINELQPDIVVVVEGPNRTKELQLFFDEDVEGDWQTFVQYTKRATQTLGIAVRTDTDQFDENEPVRVFDTNDMEQFDDFEFDMEEDGISELYKFARKPVYAEIILKNGKLFRVMGLHLKSKGIFDLLEWSKFWQKSEANRRRILASAHHIRRSFIEPYLTNEETKDIPLIICGDINDGPGFDTSEKEILGSGIEKLMGEIWKPQFILGNALYDTYQTLHISTTRYADPIFNFNYKYHYVWIDHILYTKNSDYWVYNGQIHKEMANGMIWSEYPHSSDHQPITVDIRL